MSQPWQLRKTPRRNPHARGYARKPVTDTLPCFDVNALLHATPRENGIIRTQQVTNTSHPKTIGLRLTCETIEVKYRPLHRGQTPNVQALKLKWICTHFGRTRPAIHCDKCNRPFIKLYN